MPLVRIFDNLLATDIRNMCLQARPEITHNTESLVASSLPEIDIGNICGKLILCWRESSTIVRLGMGRLSPSQNM